jgi:hypothetical protein
MVGRKEKIAVPLRLIMLVCLFVPIGLQAQSLEQGKKKIAAREMEYNKKFNFGVKGGFRSTNYMVTDFQVEDSKITDTQKNYRLGYYAALFARLNFKRNFLQTEVAYNIDRAEVLFDKNTDSNDNTESFADVSSNIHTLSIPLMYGYYFIHNGPYTLSAFIGPKLEYMVKTDVSYNNFDQQNIHEKLHPLNVAIVAGISVSISKIFFDFRYEQETMNVSHSITYDKQDATNSTGNIKFHRRGSALSFSFGFIF